MAAELPEIVVLPRTRAEVGHELMAGLVARLALAYIRESPRPDCHPDYKFRVTLPDGTAAYRGTREEAFRLFLGATLPEVSRP